MVSRHHANRCWSRRRIAAQRPPCHAHASGRGGQEAGSSVPTPMSRSSTRRFRMTGRHTLGVTAVAYRGCRARRRRAGVGGPRRDCSDQCRSDGCDRQRRQPVHGHDAGWAFRGVRVGGVEPSSGDTNGVGDVFVRDRQSGVTERVSVGIKDAEGNGDGFRNFFGDRDGPVDQRRRTFRRLQIGGFQPRPRQSQRRDRCIRPRPVVGRHRAGQRGQRTGARLLVAATTLRSAPMAASWLS